MERVAIWNLYLRAKCLDMKLYSRSFHLIRNRTSPGKKGRTWIGWTSAKETVQCWKEVGQHDLKILFLRLSPTEPTSQKVGDESNQLFGFQAALGPRLGCLDCLRTLLRHQTYSGVHQPSTHLSQVPKGWCSLHQTSLLENFM